VDVARAARVSRQTVSNVVNAPERVAPETLARVTREIHRLGFRPSRAARTLALQRAGAWGLELNVRGVGRLGSVLDAFLVELTASSVDHDAHILPFAARDPGAPIPAYEEVLASGLADGFILTDTRRDDPRPDWLATNRIPYAAFGRIWDDPTVGGWVDVDGAAGVATAVHHLAEQGFERIGFLGWPEGSPVGDDRRSGWRTATAELGIAQESRQAISLQSHRAAAEAAGPLIDDVGPGGAIVCASDLLAVGVWRRAIELGLRPGVDLGLVGFDDTESADALGLSAMRQPLAEVASQVLAILGREPGAPNDGILLAPELVVRASSCRAGAAPEHLPHSSTPGTPARTEHPAGDRTPTDGETT
jgi:DNA-binding LacI/PurR family transcriptional regulator